MSVPFAMSIPAAAAYLGVSRKVLDAAINEEKLIARRIGVKATRWSIEVADLEAWYRGLAVGRNG